MEKLINLDDYQAKTRLTAVYPPIAGAKFLYPVLGLSGEAGELTNKVKIVFRDHNGQMNAEQREQILHELGDVLWYVSRIADDLEISLSEVATMNINKLLSRKNRQVLAGSGDTR